MGTETDDQRGQPHAIAAPSFSLVSSASPHTNKQYLPTNNTIPPITHNRLALTGNSYHLQTFTFDRKIPLAWKAFPCLKSIFLVYWKVFPLFVGVFLVCWCFSLFGKVFLVCWCFSLFGKVFPCLEGFSLFGRFFLVWKGFFLVWKGFSLFEGVPSRKSQPPLEIPTKA